MSRGADRTSATGVLLAGQAPAPVRQAGVPRGAGWHWIVVFVAIVCAWGYMFRKMLPPGALEGVAAYGSEFWLSLCAVSPSNSGFPELYMMWLVMSCGMMLPTVIPALAVYDQLRLSGAGTRIGFVELAAGYLLVWALHALAMAGTQVLVSRNLAFADSNADGFLWQTAMVLAAAGIYQFLPAKDACLVKCRSPFMFFMANWQDKTFNDWRLGMRLGAVCVGCCWLLMAVFLVSGSMSLLWMGLATVLMGLEKLPDIGRHVSKPLGLTLIGGAVLAAANGT